VHGGIGVESYSTEFKYIEKITGTEPQQNRIVLNIIYIFKNVAHSLNPGLGVLPGSKLCTTYLNIAKCGVKTIYIVIQITGTGSQPDYNRKLR